MRDELNPSSWLEVQAADTGAPAVAALTDQQGEVESKEYKEFKSRYGEHVANTVRGQCLEVAEERARARAEAEQAAAGRETSFQIGTNARPMQALTPLQLETEVALCLTESKMRYDAALQGETIVRQDGRASGGGRGKRRRGSVRSRRGRHTPGRRSHGSRRGRTGVSRRSRCSSRPRRHRKGKGCKRGRGSYRRTRRRL